MAIYKVYVSFACFSSVKRFNSLVFTYSLRGLIKSILVGYLDAKVSIILSHFQGMYISMNIYK